MVKHPHVFVLLAAFAYIASQASGADTGIPDTVQLDDSGKAYCIGTDGQGGSVEFSNMIHAYYAGPECGLHLGDVNTDCQIDIDDAVYIINYIFNSGPTPGGDR